MAKGTQREVVIASGCAVIGLDVHKKSIHAAIRVARREVRTAVLPPTADAVIALAAPYREALGMVVYEAGPTGFALARALAQAGIPVMVVAPGKTPQPAVAGSKSDRLDCRKLAHLAEAGVLAPVAVPTAEEDQDRQLARLRNGFVTKRRRTKQQIRGFLLHHALPEPAGLSGWSRRAVAALAALPLAEVLRFCLDELLAELRHLEDAIARIDRQLAALGKTARHAQSVALLRTHPAAGPALSLAFVTEVYQPARFTDADQVASYLGMAPRIRQSGDRSRGGPLLKAGRGYLRALLVEAAWRWVGRDPAAQAVYRRLLANTGSAQTAIVGVARRLGIVLWRMLDRQEAYRQAV